MRIVRIHIENFRGISLADIYLNGTSVFLAGAAQQGIESAVRIRFEGVCVPKTISEFIR